MDALLEDLVGQRDQVCVASGKIIKDVGYYRCKVCKHPMMVSEIRNASACALCHAPLPPPGDKARQVHGLPATTMQGASSQDRLRGGSYMGTDALY